MTREVLVPVADVGIGTGWAWVVDGRGAGRLRVRADRVRLDGLGRVCVVAASHGVEDGLHRVTLPGGIAAWVRAVPIPESPRGNAA